MAVTAGGQRRGDRGANSGSPQPVEDVGTEPLADARANLDRYVRRQAGVISLEQLRHCGFTDRMVHGMAERRQLVRLHQGVYAAGHAPLAVRSRHIAGLLAGGRDSLLTHHSCAQVWRLPVPHDPRVHIGVTSRARRSTEALAVHLVRPLPLDDRRILHGLRVTTVPRLLLDLADVLEDPEFERVVAEAQVRRLLDPTALAKLLARSPGRRRGRLATVAGLVGRTRSEMERRLLRELRAARLLLPLTNERLHEWEVDAWWPQHDLVVELDGWQWHDTRLAFRRDRRKDRALRRRGLVVLRFTWEDLVEGVAVDELRELLPAV